MNNQTLDSKVCRNLQLPLAIMVVFCIRLAFHLMLTLLV